MHHQGIIILSEEEKEGGAHKLHGWGQVDVCIVACSKFPRDSLGNNLCKDSLGSVPRVTLGSVHLI